MSLSTARPTDQRGSRPLTAPALVAAVLGFFVVTLDAVIVNVALPSVRTDLGGGVAGLQWVVDGYILTFAALLLTAGSLGDRLGARRAFGIWHDGLRPGLRRVRAGADAAVAGRRPGRAGSGRRDDDAVVDGADPADLSRAAAPRSCSGAMVSPPATAVLLDAVPEHGVSTASGVFNPIASWAALWPSPCSADCSPVRALSWTGPASACCSGPPSWPRRRRPACDSLDTPLTP